MSNAVFPDLPGLDIKVRKTPVWNTAIKTAVSGKELRASFYSTPIYKFSLAYNVLRAGAEQELQNIVGFFNARKGRFDNFLFSDPTDNSVVDQAIGTGDGATLAFQLVRTIGGNTEPVMNIAGTPEILLDGSALTAGSNYSIDAYGMVTFTAAPPLGAALTWTGSFYHRCRFEQDSMDFDRFLWNLWEAKRVELRGSLGVKI